MLKRQRPVSPFPTSSEVPLISDSYSFDDAEQRELKRKRKLPPTSDWGLGTEDEEASEHEEMNEGRDRSMRRLDQDEYKSTNHLLHELHTLQQHRLLFSSHPSSAQKLSTSTSATSYNHYEDVIPKVHTPGRLVSQNKDPISFLSSESGPSKDELLYVTERYEETNRLLGSLFLSRRRQLDAAESQRNT